MPSQSPLGWFASMPVENCIHTACAISVAQSYLVWNWPSKSIGVASIFFMIAFVIVIWLVVLYDCTCCCACSHVAGICAHTFERTMPLQTHITNSKGESWQRKNRKGGDQVCCLGLELAFPSIVRGMFRARHNVRGMCARLELRNRTWFGIGLPSRYA